MTFREQLAVETEKELRRIREQHIILWLGSQGIDTKTLAWVKRQIEQPKPKNDDDTISMWMWTSSQIKNTILALLDCYGPMTVTDVKKHIDGDITTQRVATLLRSLELSDKKIESFRKNAHTYFRIPLDIKSEIWYT